MDDEKRELAQNLIDAVGAKDPGGVVDAFEALYAACGHKDEPASKDEPEEKPALVLALGSKGKK